ncbi:Spy/CpxP family protein refolding chaperone [Dechloromonas sp. ARDL1]|uniref:Spy/CpxP family protein refolding chaperone n=1 Tax=Dechloromonas sp. ARDL1 TaxID=3322121 RepID=UPI003DA6FA1F
MLKNKKLRFVAAMALGTSIAALSAPSFAQRGGCMGDGPMGGKVADGRFAERMQQHQQRLHDALKLAPQQEGAWTKFQESHPFAGNIKRPDPVDMAKLTAPERAEKMLEMQKQHQDAMGKHVAAMKDFYAQLTPEQKKVFDEHNMMGKRGQRDGMRGPGPQGPANPPPTN